jgi:hypothetical protein
MSVRFHDVTLAGQPEAFGPDRQGAPEQNAFGEFVSGQVGMFVRDIAEDRVLIFLPPTFDDLQRRPARAVKVIVEK